mgnify:CR=1 FL=1
MIQPIENKVYLGYANMLFSFFEGCKKGEGGFLMRHFRSIYHSFEKRPYLDILYKVLHNLCVNGFLEPKDADESDTLEGWINLTTKGYDYMQGGPLTVNKVNFNQYIQLTDPDNKQFDDLWLLIGETDKAPFYLKGPTYLNMIRPYLSDYVGDYMTYMEERRQKEQPTSRRVWYRELYVKVPIEKREELLSDLSYAVSLSYYYKEEADEDYDEMINELMASIDDEISAEVPELPELNLSPASQRQTPEELLTIALEICHSFKSLIENNRLYRLLYNDDETAKNETAAQLLFYSIAQGYCKKYDVDINRESDPGIGELDFKLSVGSTSKVIIEMKLSTNGTLLHGFERQLPAYLRAEEAKYGICLVLQMKTTVEPQLERLKLLYGSIKDKPQNSLYLICVDATPKPSASKI